MRVYLPAETDVVTENANGGHGWLTLTAETEVTTYGVAVCPVRDSLPVLFSVVNGVKIWFLESQVKVELPESMTANINIQKMVTLEYDVPARVSQNAARYPDENGKSFQHPSIWMWGVGARTSGSVWILPAEKIPYRRIRTLIRAGCNYRVTYIDSSDVVNHVQRTVVTLRNEWLSSEQAYLDCMVSAKERLEERNHSEAATEQYEKDIKRVEKDREKKQKNILLGAALFSVPEEWVCKGTTSFADANAIVHVAANLNVVRRSGREVMDSRVDAHCNLVDKLQEAGETGMAVSVETGVVPHDIAADYAEDKEVMTSDETFSLRELFKGE